MERWGLVVAVALATYATRVTGFYAGGRALPPALDRFLGYVPVAVFAALAAPGVADGSGAMAPRLAGALAAAVVMLRFNRLWAGLAAGMGAFWLVAALPGG